MLAGNAAAKHSILQEARQIVQADDRHRFHSSSNVRRKEAIVARLCQRTTLAPREEERRLRAAEMAADDCARNRARDRKTTAPYEVVPEGDRGAHAHVYLARDANPKRDAAASAPPDAQAGERLLALCRRGDAAGALALVEQVREARNAREQARHAKHTAWLASAWDARDKRVPPPDGDAEDTAAPVRVLVDFQDARGRTPAMEALAGGHTELAARFLLDLNANAAIRDDMGRNALHFAALANAAGLVDALLADARYNAPLAPRVFAKSHAPTQPRLWEVRDASGKRASDLTSNGSVRAALQRKMAEAGGGVPVSVSKLARLDARRTAAFRREIKDLRLVLGESRPRGALYATPAGAAFGRDIDDVASRMLRAVLGDSLESERGQAPPFRSTTAAILHHDLNLRQPATARLPAGAGGEAPGMVRNHAADTAPGRDPEELGNASVESALDALGAVLPAGLVVRVREAYADLRRRERLGKCWTVGEAMGLCALLTDVLHAVGEGGAASEPGGWWYGEHAA